MLLLPSNNSPVLSPNISISSNINLEIENAPDVFVVIKHVKILENNENNNKNNKNNKNQGQDKMGL